MFLIVFELFPAVHPEAATTGSVPAGNWWGGQPPGPPAGPAPGQAKGASGYAAPQGPGSSGYAPGLFFGGVSVSACRACGLFYLLSLRAMIIVEPEGYMEQ